MTTQSSSTPAEIPTFGRVGYDAYGEHPSAHGKWTTFDGRGMPTWEEYSAAGPGSSGAFTQARWETAAAAIIAEYERRKAPSGFFLRVRDLLSRLWSGGQDMPEEDLHDEPAGEDPGPVASMTLTAWTPEAGAAVVNFAQGRVAELRHSPGVPLVNAPDTSSEGQIDPFLMGISEIASATRDLAEASRAVNPTDTEIIELISDVATALHSRVKALAPPPTEPTANA